MVVNARRDIEVLLYVDCNDSGLAGFGRETVRCQTFPQRFGAQIGVFAIAATSMVHVDLQALVAAVNAPDHRLSWARRGAYPDCEVELLQIVRGAVQARPSATAL
jgi:hypothetical protein